MSKRRNSSHDMPRSLKSTILHEKNPETTKFSQKQFQKSFLQRTRHRTLESQISVDDQNLKTIFNKQNDFNPETQVNLDSLQTRTINQSCPSFHLQDKVHKISKKIEQIRKLSDRINIKTRLEPFLVADKTTCNQKYQKDLNDIKGRTKRISNAFYRWHNKTGVGIKNSCFFESKLRETSTQFFKKDTFLNLFNPIQQKVVEQKRYKDSELICPRQRRLFTLQN